MKNKEKIICAGCTLEIKLINGTIPNKCPNCGRDLSRVNLRCLGSKCKGNTLIIEMAGCGGHETASCPECGSRELFETDKPIPFDATVGGVKA